MNHKNILATFCAFVAIGLLWAAAMPINAAPDEDQHLIWAASAARLQFSPEGAKGERTLAAPSTLYLQRCFQWQPDVSAACQDGPRDNPEGDRRNKKFDRSAPYYLVVGMPSLLTSTSATGYLMRLAHIALTAAMITLGVWSMSARRQTAGSIAMATVAFTPMAAFLIGTVNPSGTAIASGFALWAGGLFLTGSDRPMAQRVAAIAIPVLVFLVVRRDAVIWLLPTLAILTLHAGPRRVVDTFRRPAVRVVALASPLVILGVFLLGDGLFVRLAQGPSGNYEPGTASSSFGILRMYADELIGELGWLDTILPQPVLMGWYGLIAIALLVSIGASRRDAYAVTAIAAYLLVIPYLFGVLYTYRYYQGRYGLPLAVGVPLIASAALAAERGRHLVNARMARVVVWTVAVLSTVAFGVAMRRFTVGYRGSWPDMLFDPEWSPPLPSFVLLGAYAALMAALAVVLCRAVGRVERVDGTSPSA